MNVNDCFKKRILKKIPIDKNKVDGSFRISLNKLERSKRLLNSDFFNESIVSSYTSMFHASRALLYPDGLQEKSHYAVYIYLNEKYSNMISKELLNAFFNYQKERHDVLYGFNSDFSKEDAEDAVLYAEDFLYEIRRIINKN